MYIIVTLVIALLLLLLTIMVVLKRVKAHANPVETMIGAVYLLSLLLFVGGLITHGNAYHQPIDPMDDLECYSPFASGYRLTLLWYFVTFHISLILVWINGNHLPPLTLSLALVFLLIGIILNLVILLQVSVHATETLMYYDGGLGKWFFIPAPLFGICIAAYLLYTSVRTDLNASIDRTYNNRLLQMLNRFLASRISNPFWILLLLFPVVFIVTLILRLFGQDTNALVKLFTDTATWRLSQQIHPPILDHHGHYLCTVAASGNPAVVKPLRMGQRSGRLIIVNRQLLIANAFEEMIQDLSPKLHQIIRTNYDKYGYNLSRKINSSALSNITYVLMKPLEWAFLLCLYLFCLHPEQKINRQYPLHNNI